MKHKMDHLVCFLPALLALGVQQGAVQGPKGQQYLSLAEDLTYTCWKMYSRQPSGALLLQPRHLQSGSPCTCWKMYICASPQVRWFCTPGPCSPDLTYPCGDMWSRQPSGALLLRLGHMQPGSHLYLL